MCDDHVIKELLPRYLRGALDRRESDDVARHIAACEDCRTELHVLRFMADETVPDPGDAFWASLPGRVRRGIDAQQETFTGSRMSWLRDFIALRRMAVATASFAALALAAWILYRPAYLGEPGRSMSGNGALIEAEAAVEPVNISELSPTELAAASQWAQNAMEPIREAADAYLRETDDRSVFDGLSGLDSRELDRLNELLKKKERETQEKPRKRRGSIPAAG